MTSRILLWTLGAALWGRAQCVPVPGERILARDLARALPVFAGLPPELALGYAPAPGARRVYAAAELGRLARRYGLAVEPGMEACFARPAETLTPDRVAAAAASSMPAAGIEVLDFSRQPVPPGELRFPLSGLENPRASASPSGLLWRGRICRPGQEDFPVWARVHLRVSGVRVRAAEALSPAAPIAGTQIRAEAYEGSPGLPGPSEVVGRRPRKPIPAGTLIEAQMLEAPEDVRRGDRVQVEVWSGRARLSLEGQAQASGRRGETIPVRNPANGKIFRASVRDRGEVSVALGAEGAGLGVAAAPGGGSR